MIILLFLIQYGSATLQGLTAIDTACIGVGGTSCVSSNYQFLAISYETGLNNMDGILGLSPDNGSNGPSYVSYLRNAGLIDQRMLGFFIGDKAYQSTVMFGGYDSSYVKSGDDKLGYGIHWYDLTGTNWW